MKIRLRSWFKNHSVSYLGLGLCLVVALTAVAYPVLAQADPTPGGALGGFWGNFAVDGLLDVIVKAVFSGLAFVGMAIAALVGNLCIVLINSYILPGQNSLLFSSQIRDAWQVMLNLANLVFFISLVAFAVMIITRTGGYNLKKAVTSLITTVVLANLSYQLVLVLIEAGDALRNLAASLLGFNAGQWTTALQGLNALWDPALIYNIDANVLKYMLIATLSLAMGLTVTFVLFRLVFILIERAIRIVVLTIFGPLQIALGLLPQKEVQGLAGNWFGELVKWVLVMPVTFLILAIGQKLAPANSLVALREFIITSWDPATGPSVDQLTGTGDIFFGLISIGIMFAATKAPDMLKVSLSAFSKTFTDFADKTVLGGIQKNMTAGLNRRWQFAKENTIAKVDTATAGWSLPLSKIPGLKLKDFKIGTAAFRDREALLEERAAGAKSWQKKQERATSFDGFMADHQNKIFEIVNEADRKTEATSAYKDLDKKAREFLRNGDLKNPDAIRANFDLDQMISKGRRQALAKAEKEDVQFAIDNKTFLPRASQTLKNEAAIRTGIDLVDSAIAQMEKHEQDPNATVDTKAFLEHRGFTEYFKGFKGAQNKNEMLDFLDDKFLQAQTPKEREHIAHMIDEFTKFFDKDNVQSGFLVLSEVGKRAAARGGKSGDATALTDDPDEPAAYRLVRSAQTATGLAQDIATLSSQVSSENKDKAIQDIDSQIATSISEDLKISTEQHQDLQQLSGEGAKLLDQAYFTDKDKDSSIGLQSVLSRLGDANSPMAQSIVSAIAGLQGSQGTDRDDRTEDLARLITTAGINSSQASAASQLLANSSLNTGDLKGMTTFAQSMGDRSANPADANYVADSKIRELLGSIQDRDIKVQVEQTSGDLSQVESAQTQAKEAIVDEAENTRFVEALRSLGDEIKNGLKDANAEALDLMTQLAGQDRHNEPISSIAQAGDNPQVVARLDQLLNKITTLSRSMSINPTGSANLNVSAEDLKKALGSMSLNQIVQQFTAPAANAIKKLNQK